MMGADIMISFAHSNKMQLNLVCNRSNRAKLALSQIPIVVFNPSSDPRTALWRLLKDTQSFVVAQITQVSLSLDSISLRISVSESGSELGPKLFAKHLKIFDKFNFLILV